MQPNFEYFLKTILLGLSFSLLFTVVILGFQWYSGVEFILNNVLLIKVVKILLYGTILTVVNRYYFDFALKGYLWKKFPNYKLLFAVAGSVSINVAAFFLLAVFDLTMLRQQPLGDFFSVFSFIEVRNFAIVAAVLATAFYGAQSYKNTQETKIKQQKIIAGTASAQFESLKNQIDPHFLFNSLNVLSSLIEENPQNAQRFTTSLSKIYRYVLEQKDKELISVTEELAFANTYMNLLKMRFENSLSFEVPEVISNPEGKVVPLSLQLLLENTVKHNVVSEQRPLHIRIKDMGDYLIVENDLQKKEILQDRKGVGLQNIVDRYGILTSRKVLIEETKSTFSVSLPILTKQVSVMENTNNITQDKYLKAQKRVEDLKGFYGNLTSYVIVNTGLLILNLVTSPQHLWFYYPLLGWGIGVALHAMKVFNYMPILNRDWEERKIKELMEKDNNSKWK